MRKIVREIRGTLIAVLLHPLDELRIHRFPAEEAGRLLGDAAQDNALPVARVARIGARSLARQCPHGRNHAAVVGVVVVRAEHMRLTCILVLDRDIEPRHTALKHLGIITACEPVTAVCGSREPRIDRRQIVKGLPCLRFEQVTDARTIRPRRVAKNAYRGAFPCTLPRLPLLLEPGGICEDVLAHIVLLVALIEVAHHAHRLIDPAHSVRNSIAEQSADACRHIDTRPLQLGDGDDLETADTLRGSQPYGTHPHEIEELCDALPMAPHIRARPEDNPNRLRIAPLIADILLDEGITELFSVLPCSSRRHTARVETVEIPPRREHIHAVCRRCACRAWLDVSSCERAQRLRNLPLCTAQTRHHILRDLVQRMRK